MILRLVHPGAAPRGPLAAATETYLKRLRHMVRVEETWVKPAKQRGRAQALADEGPRVLAAVGARDRLVVLAVGGRAWSSEHVAKRLAAWQAGGHAAICFALGGPWGLDAAVSARADEVWSFGALTLPHDLARLVMWEQLYRAHTILRGEPYHKV